MQKDAEGTDPRREGTRKLFGPFSSMCPCAVSWNNRINPEPLLPRQVQGGTGASAARQPAARQASVSIWPHHDQGLGALWQTASIAPATYAQHALPDSLHHFSRLDQSLPRSIGELSAGRGDGHQVGHQAGHQVVGGLVKQPLQHPHHPQQQQQHPQQQNLQQTLQHPQQQHGGHGGGPQVVYRVVGSRAHVKKTDSGQQTDNGGFRCVPSRGRDGLLDLATVL